MGGRGQFGYKEGEHITSAAGVACQKIIFWAAMLST